MAYNFKNDKSAFFNATEPFTLDAVEDYARRAQVLNSDGGAEMSSYAFALQANIELEAEFDNLTQVLESHKDKKEWSSAVWSYYYYCCRLLMEFYGSDKPDERAYHNPSKRAYYENYAAKIKRHVNDAEDEPLVSTPFIKELKTDFSELLKTPLRVSSIKNKLGMMNMFRVYWVFCRLTFTTGLHHFRDKGFIDLFEKTLSSKFDENEFIRKMEAPNFIFNALSVGLFAGRLLLNVAMLMKHTFFPQGAEKNATVAQRFKFELYKRHPVLMNDAAWATVNLLTNYPELINISAPVANWLIAGFLLFDFCLILWQRNLAEKEFRHKRNQYRQELDGYCDKSREIETAITQKEVLFAEKPFDSNSDSLLKEIEKLKAQHALNQELISLTMKTQRELEISWEVKNSTFLFNAAAAFLFIAGFTASFIFAAPVVALVSYATCMVAVAMYLSSGSYGQYKAKSLRFYDANCDFEKVRGGLVAPGLELIKANHQSLQEYQAARRAFGLKIAENVIIPTLVLGLMAACWQAAVVFIVLYASYKLYQHYHKPEKPELVLADQSVLPAPDDDELLLHLIHAS